ncbi:hypothetical protein QTG54_014416 [Skeletonema marinoi]|uniref:Uncharacterized protein n=1 Tax=Skeletonema marinoi TaxID=267567 RepID=A0AAD8XX73_9STRA|nr:hypothetical protein QTG54_014416 [Skeletonema marinoi]
MSAAVDSGDANLKKSDAAAGDLVLVRYCSDECHPDHRPHQEAMCEETAAELPAMKATARSAACRLLEEATIAGHPQARCNLAGYEWRNERFDRAVKLGSSLLTLDMMIQYKD